MFRYDLPGHGIFVIRERRYENKREWLARAGGRHVFLVSSRGFEAGKKRATREDRDYDSPRLFPLARFPPSVWAKNAEEFFEYALLEQRQTLGRGGVTPSQIAFGIFVGSKTRAAPPRLQRAKNCP